MKLKLSTIVGMYDKTKDGKPLLTKNGKPYRKANVKFYETGDKIVSMNVWQGKEIKESEVFEGEITEREWQGKKYFDFKVDNKEEKQGLEIAQIKFSLSKHDSQIKEIQDFIRQQFPNYKGVSKDDYPEYTGEPNFEDANAELETIGIIK